MGFLSFNEKYYRQRLDVLENRTLTDEELYEARQLLKVLDDLADEGYTNLNDHMESRFSCLSRLRSLIRKAGSSPFPIDHERLTETSYSEDEFEMEVLINKMLQSSENRENASDNPFLDEIYRYCEWVGYEEDTAYVFLLRDALLPYVYFRSRHDEHVYPWLISRRFLESVTKTGMVDDDIRLPLYEALEEGLTSFPLFNIFCRERILAVLEDHKELKAALQDLLGHLKEKKIIVVESGYVGTIPMMLKAMDDRVDFKLYTTAPFLFETYKGRIFCRRYEDIRRFETVYSQDLLLQYASFHDRRFFVHMSEDETVLDRSLDEMKCFLR